MKQKILIVVALLVCIGGGAVWWFLRGDHGKPGESAENTADEAICLVKTQIVKQQNLPVNLTVFGDVNTGKVEAASFPQAGQISQLLVVPGQQVHKGQALATIISDPNAQSTYAQAASAANFARAELHRNEDLFTLQLATQSQVDAAHKALQDAETNLESQKKLGGGQGSASLSAQFDGVVTAILLGQGDRIQAGATILQMGRTNTLRVQFGIEPVQSNLIHAGMPVTLFAVQEPKKKVTAKITEIQHVVDPKTQLVAAVAEVPADSAPNLVVGMHAQGVIQLGQRLAWSVPRQAVLIDDKGAYVFQIANGKASRVEVEKLVENGDTFGIDGKIDPKLPVVVLGNYELQDGMPVREAAQ